MSDLLDSVLKAHEWLDRWHQLSHVRACIVSGGELWGIKGLVQDQPPRQMTGSAEADGIRLSTKRRAYPCRRRGPANP